MKEEWAGGYLGDCEARRVGAPSPHPPQLPVQKGFSLKVSKDGLEALNVTNVEVDTVDEDCSKFLIWEFGCEFKAAETFTCGSYLLGASDGKMKTRQTNDCRTRDYSHEKLKKVRRSWRLVLILILILLILLSWFYSTSIMFSS